jgi:two-component system nitrogen regulation response regulator NtrX
MTAAKQAHILVVEDNYEICQLIQEILKEKNYDVTLARNTKTALEAAEKIRPNVIILDIWLEKNHLDGIGLLKKLKQIFPDVPIIMISGHANVELAASTIKFGAYDFIEKPFKTEKLLIVVQRALETKELQDINLFLQHNPSVNSTFRLSHGPSKIAQKLKQDIKSLANSNCRIIISGELGSQPSQVAKEIHDLSSRSQKPFITLSGACAGNYDSINLTLFGNDSEQSLFEMASGGTLVLENLHTIPMAVQSRILDALQKESVTRHNKVIRFDTRIIATFEKKEGEVSDFINQRVLNEMLYHRLNVKRLELAPLRSRIDDIVPLFSSVLISHLDRNVKVNIDSLKYALTAYNWPCNSEELCNAAEYSLIMAKNSDTENLTLEMLHPNILGCVKDDFGNFANINAYLEKDYKSAKKLFDIQYIKAQLHRFSNNVAKTARFMGVDRAALYRKIRSLLGIQGGDKKLAQLINREKNVSEVKEEASEDFT